MKLSINPNYLAKKRVKDFRRDPFERIQLCYEAGFRVLDCSIPVTSDRWEELIDQNISAAEHFGIELEQSHFPDRHYKRVSDDDFREQVRRAVIAAVRMKTSHAVIHADGHADGKPMEAQKVLETEYEFWAPFAEELAKNNISLAIETVFEDHVRVSKDERSRFSATLEELLAIIERFDNPMVGCCYDTGHAKLSFGADGMADSIRALGKHIKCTHVHDNYYGKDLHLMPFMGDIKWEEVMRAFKEIEYAGNLTFEFVYGELPENLTADFLNTAYKTGKHLVSLFENGN